MEEEVAEDFHAATVCCNALSEVWKRIFVSFVSGEEFLYNAMKLAIPNQYTFVVKLLLLLLLLCFSLRASATMSTVTEAACTSLPLTLAVVDPSQFKEAAEEEE